MKDIVSKVLNLAKLSLRADEFEKMEEHFQKVLKMVNKLKEVDTQDVEPLFYPHDNVKLRLRDDKIGESLTKIEVLENAPDFFTDFIKAPSPLKGLTKKST